MVHVSPVPWARTRRVCRVIRAGAGAAGGTALLGRAGRCWLCLCRPGTASVPRGSESLPVLVHALQVLSGFRIRHLPVSPCSFHLDGLPVGRPPNSVPPMGDCKPPRGPGLWVPCSPLPVRLARTRRLCDSAWELTDALSIFNQLYSHLTAWKSQALDSVP